MVSRAAPSQAPLDPPVLLAGYAHAWAGGRTEGERVESRRESRRVVLERQNVVVPFRM